VTTPAAPPLRMLDTTVLIATIRMGTLGQHVEAAYGLSAYLPVPPKSGLAARRLPI